MLEVLFVPRVLKSEFSALSPGEEAFQGPRALVPCTLPTSGFSNP